MTRHWWQFPKKQKGAAIVYFSQIFFFSSEKKIKDYLRFWTHAGETRFPIFAWGSLGKWIHFVNFMGLMLTLTLEIVKTIPDPVRPCKRF